MASTPVEAASPMRDIPIRTITEDDLTQSLRDGYKDFLEKRGDLVFIGLLYPLIGLCVAIAANGGSILPLLFPMLAGLSLLGPLVSTGFYQLAKRREAGLESNWWHFFDVFKSPSREAIFLVGIMLMAIFGGWLMAAGITYAVFFGTEPPATVGVLLTQAFATPQGWAMILIGNAIGLAFAVIVLATSLVSLPLLIDKRMDAATAVRTSLKAFAQNRAVLLRWGLCVAVLLVLGAIPFLLGLAFVLPVLGYATWHLYTRLIDRGRLSVD
jgi:uncharacterized membrane protein